MNIKNRLKNLENQLTAQDSDFCGCFAGCLKVAVEAVYNSEPNIQTEDCSPDFEKGFCEKCRKPFSDKDIEMTGKLVKIYGDQK